jgi:dolichol-phosphate mannosyltransferase
VRRLAKCGEQVGFYESDAPVESSMYAHWREIWNNWPRSLAMRDQYFGWREALGLLGVIFVQALPLPAMIFARLVGLPSWVVLAAALLTMIRAGVLIGAARAYPNRPWTYWLSPLMDLPVALRIVQFALRRRHTWRGRTYVRV